MSQTKGVSYELALELKDAGFPQKREDACQHEINGFHIPGKVYTRDVCEYVTIPTLSELIEECEEDFVLLTRWKEQGGKFTWQVRGERGVVSFVYLGSTPEEAVARLYIAIHSSQNLDKPGIITVNQ